MKFSGIHEIKQMHLNVPDHGVSKFNSNIPWFGTFTQSRKLIEGRGICVNCQPLASKSAFSSNHMSTDISLILSRDGSHTLFNPILNETYHSKHGALQEALHVYIKNGLLVFKELEKVTILEVGFGTGLNALLTWNKAEVLKLKVEYHTLEPFPIGNEITSQLNYPSLLEVEEPLSAERFKRLHDAAWEEEVILSEYFTIYKYKSTLEEKTFPPNTFNVCYFDAFAPNHQGDIWREENFKKVYDSLVEGGILTTYCAQSAFKRTLKAAGFQVEALEGPKWKKEMTRGRKG